MWLKVFKSFLELSEITTTHKVSDAQKAFPSATSSRRATKSRDGRQLAEGKGGTCARWKEWGHEEKKKCVFLNIYFATMEPVCHRRMPSKTAGGCVRALWTGNTY